MITIRAKDPECRARTGILHLPKGDVPVPAFMPVGTNGTVKAILHSTLEHIGYPLILGNAYHLYLRPGIEVIKKYGSLHTFSSWNANILTDSGGFQIFSLAAFRKINDDGVTFQSHIDGSKHHLTPEKVVEIQTLLGSDIQMQLDVCTEPGISKHEAAKALELTTKWAIRAQERRSDQDESYQGHLFGIVQGNFYKDLRVQSAEQLATLDLPGYAIGGLSVGENQEIFKDYLHFTASLLPDTKPKYVMGIGTPDYMLEAIEAGIDLFDCVYPTRIARNGTCFTWEGMLHLKNARYKNDVQPVVPGCICPACTQYSRGYLRHLFMAHEILGPMLVTHHNLQFLYTMMDQARDSIVQGSFLEFKKAFLQGFRGEI